MKLTSMLLLATENPDTRRVALTSHCVEGTFRVFLKRLSQLQDVFLIVKVGISGPIHSDSFMCCKLSALSHPITMYGTALTTSLVMLSPASSSL